MPIYDIITLPVRLITAIPRYIYNLAHPKEDHPFYRYLIENGVPAAALSADYVYLEFICLENRGVFGQEGEESLTSMGETFNFIELPISESNVTVNFSKFGVPNQQQQPLIEEVI